MPFRVNLREQTAALRYVVLWVLLAAPIAAVIGSASALFLWLLEFATHTRWSEPRLLYLLPVAGIGIALLYQWLGQPAERGNDLIMDEIHEPGGGVPARMAPLILISTVITHLFGGSAGREGTAIQMGGSIASALTRWLGLSERDKRTLLMTGVAAGFGSVFGTPFAGAIFAIEVLAIGKISHESLIPCLLASIVGDWSCAAWGIHHTDYHEVMVTLPAADWLLLGKVAIAATAFGLVSLLFAELTHALKRVFLRAISWPVLRPAVGGLIVIALVHLLGSRDYLGLGVESPPGERRGVSILSSFELGGADAFSWWWKLLFTAVTLSSGFKGGEVTPLFFVGASLGNALAVLLGAPVDLFAALGFVAVFAGATNTPIACTVMGIELFGADHTLYLAVACCLAYLFSGHSGIYLSQRISTAKLPSVEQLSGTSLRERRDSLAPWSWPLASSLRFLRPGQRRSQPAAPSPEPSDEKGDTDDHL